MKLGQELISLFYKGISLKCILKKHIPANIKRENNLISRTEIWFIFYINELGI